MRTSTQFSISSRFQGWTIVESDGKVPKQTKLSKRYAQVLWSAGSIALLPYDEPSFPLVLETAIKHNYIP